MSSKRTWIAGLAALAATLAATPGAAAQRAPRAPGKTSVEALELALGRASSDSLAKLDSDLQRLATDHTTGRTPRAATALTVSPGGRVMVDVYVNALAAGAQ